MRILGPEIFLFLLTQFLFQRPKNRVNGGPTVLVHKELPNQAIHSLILSVIAQFWPQCC